MATLHLPSQLSTSQPFLLTPKRGREAFAAYEVELDSEVSPPRASRRPLAVRVLGGLCLASVMALTGWMMTTPAARGVIASWGTMGIVTPSVPTPTGPAATPSPELAAMMARPTETASIRETTTVQEVAGSAKSVAPMPPVVAAPTPPAPVAPAAVRAAVAQTPAAPVARNVRVPAAVPVTPVAAPEPQPAQEAPAHPERAPKEVDAETSPFDGKPL